MANNEQNNDRGAKFIAMSVISIPLGIIGGFELGIGVKGTIGCIIAMYVICMLFTSD